MMYLLIAIAIIGPIIHLAVTKGFKNKKRVLEMFLLYFLVAFIGLGGLWAYFGHFWFAPTVAKSMGWPAGSPFQFVVATADLAFGVLGILCIWVRGEFWTATIIGSSIYLLGNAVHHISDMIWYKDFAPGNAGLVLYLDIIIPIVLLVMLIAYRRIK